MKYTKVYHYYIHTNFLHSLFIFDFLFVSLFHPHIRIVIDIPLSSKEMIFGSFLSIFGWYMIQIPWTQTLNPFVFYNCFNKFSAFEIHFIEVSGKVARYFFFFFFFYGLFSCSFSFIFRLIKCPVNIYHVFVTYNMYYKWYVQSGHCNIQDRWENFFIRRIYDTKWCWKMFFWPDYTA